VEGLPNLANRCEKPLRPRDETLGRFGDGVASIRIEDSDVRFRFPPMIVAQVEIRGGIDLELRALQWLYGTWLPRSGYVPDDQPGFEAWIGKPFAHGTEHFELYAQLPIKRA